MVLKLFTLVALLVAVPLCAQDAPAGNQPGNAIPVRCVNTLGTAFESCGGGGAAGTDVNISGVGGNAVTTTIPVSGTITFANTTLAVTGTFFQATQPVSGTFWQATQPVSLVSVPSHDVTNAGAFAVQATGSVTANAGANLNTSLLALEATQQSVKTAVETIDNFISGARGLVTEDNSAAIKAALDTLNAAVSTAARQDTGNASLATLAGAVVAPGVATRSTAALVVQSLSSGPPLPLFPCNAVRRTNCAPKGY